MNSGTRQSCVLTLGIIKMKILVIALLLLTSCSTYQKKTLTFIAPSTLSFNKLESEQFDKLKRNDSIVYIGKDSFFICDDYMHIKPKMMSFYKERINEYYFLNSNKNLIDHVTLEYYRGNLAYIWLYTKGKSRVDSLSNIIESFFKKDFVNKERNLKRLEQWSYFYKGKLFIGRRIFKDNYEAEFIMINKKVKIPSWCGTKTPWWYYLKFWLW
jgi:hypothetical protein